MTAKQQRFCMQFIIDYNPKEAAVRAGYATKAARAQAQTLLKSVEIQKEIQRLTAEQAKKVRITPDALVDELIQIAHAEASDKQNSPLKYSNKIKAIELLGKYWHMWDDGAKVNVTNVTTRLNSEKLEVADIERLSDDELMELASRMYPQAEPLALPVEVIDGGADEGAGAGLCGSAEIGA